MNASTLHYPRPGQLLEGPPFFLPNEAKENQEKKYAALAKRAECQLPATDKRVYAVTWILNRGGLHWRAIVGETLVGEGYRTRNLKGGNTKRVPESDFDPAIVIAIFAGNPYSIYIDGSRSAFTNPFLVNEPDSVTYFAPSA